MLRVVVDAGNTEKYQIKSHVLHPSQVRRYLEERGNGLAAPIDKEGSVIKTTHRILLRRIKVSWNISFISSSE